MRVARGRGIDGLTAKTMADELGISTQPVFTAFGSMDEVKREVYAAAVSVYDEYTELGLKEKIPFLGVEYKPDKLDEGKKNPFTQ